MKAIGPFIGNKMGIYYWEQILQLTDISNGINDYHRATISELLEARKMLGQHTVYAPDRNPGALVVECPVATWERQKKAFLDKKYYTQVQEIKQQL